MLADKWDKHIVIDIPDKIIPVYKVQKESGDASVKTLHRNMLLLFSIIPTISETDNTVSPILSSHTDLTRYCLQFRI